VLESNNTSEQRNLPHACKLQSSSHEIFDVDLDVMLATIVIDVDDECVPPPKKPKKVFVDFNHKFQELLVMKMPWAEPIFNEVGMVSTMKCGVFTKIERNRKILVVKRTLLKIMQISGKVLMVSGSWIQNVCTLRMRFLIFNVLKPLSSNS
jgi:hypothetical protein